MIVFIDFMQRASKIPLCIPSTYEMLFKMHKPYNFLPVPKPCDLLSLFCLSFLSEDAACPPLKLPCCTTARYQHWS